MHRITIDNVRLDRHVDAHHPHAEGEHADNGRDPVHFFIGGPAVPEETDGEDEGEEDHGGEAHFGLVGVVVAGCEG